MTEQPNAYYISQLKERRPEIAEFLLRCERDHVTPQDFTAMRNCIRSLTELTAPQHDSELHKLALAMRDAIHPQAPAARINLISLSRTLLAACHNTLTHTQSGTPPFLTNNPLAGRTFPATLLSVDDDRIIHSMIEAMFGAHMDVLTARNGKEGLDMILSLRPDVVLLDDAMPEMTGMKVMETLHKQAELAAIAVIMLTSSDRPQDIERAMNAGATDYVIKPFDPKTLCEKVYKQLQAM